MSRQYMIVNDDQILVDIDLVFAAIRDANGDWEAVRDDLMQVLETVRTMAEAAEGEGEEK